VDFSERAAATTGEKMQNQTLAGHQTIIYPRLRTFQRATRKQRHTTNDARTDIQRPL